MNKPMEMPHLYANAVNLAGLMHSLPVVVKYDAKTQAYWDASGNFKVTKIGTHHDRGIVTFASDKNSEVVAWTLGVKATMHILRKWSTTP